jgi:hypothetical protein
MIIVIVRMDPVTPTSIPTTVFLEFMMSDISVDRSDFVSSPIDTPLKKRICNFETSPELLTAEKAM